MKILETMIEKKLEHLIILLQFRHTHFHLSDFNIIYALRFIRRVILL